MCFSAVIQQDLDLLARQHKARIDTELFENLFARRAAGHDIKLAKGLEANFLIPRDAAARRIAQHIAAYQEATASKWQVELFKQKTRLADAERKLKTRVIQKAQDDLRIATNKIAWLRAKLADLKRTEPNSNDGRIFPFWYAPVLVNEAGERVIKPMRYHCRPSGKPASIDSRYPGLYNARRDNLEGFWKNQFGRQHAYCVVQSFYENVALHDFEKRALRDGEKVQNRMLHFNPQPAIATDGGSAGRAAIPTGINAGAAFQPSDMLVACLYDRWQKPGEPALLSFAAITDDPPPEVAATGHNRCIIPLKPQNLSAWLTPGADLAVYYALLDDRERPYYAHELAA
ncbi:MAG TPA: SOS response-associated peptidase family protein [Acidiferrobacterales bacterium]|nr:SOS response-associated peptidase family protein [Acidiferrobacterales bacterium]